MTELITIIDALSELKQIQSEISRLEAEEQKIRDIVKGLIIDLGGEYSDPSVDAKMLPESKTTRIDADRFQDLINEMAMKGQTGIVHQLMDCRIESKKKATLYIRFKKAQ